MNIVKVEPNQVELLSKFASEVFIDYYSNRIGYDQSLYMANMFLSVQAIKKLMEKGAIFKLVFDNEEPVGLIEYILEKEKVFLSKFYVRKDRRHQGIGKMMLQDCKNYALANNINKIYLTVNKGNTPSIDIYYHEGFKKIDAVVNDIGNGYVMDDYIMQLEL